MLFKLWRSIIYFRMIVIYIYTSADRKYTQLDYISFHMNYSQNFLHFGSNGQTRIQISYLEVARVGRLIPKRPEV